MGFVVAWVDFIVFPLRLNDFDICECENVFVACQVLGKLPIWVMRLNFLTFALMTIIWGYELHS